eukprot:TRINITY_DN3506_c0_g1_i1.p1 TRINITY_DN3506_c0_g1~~TRINITY_DN3506_c0_g1_i1.p1  ORF type:complete len:232 (-),score=86.38 TRINITY_DN3506_c0_g1_i1:103-798(-)
MSGSLTASDRAKKLFELRLKNNECRIKNEQDVRNAAVRAAGGRPSTDATSKKPEADSDSDSDDDQTLDGVQKKAESEHSKLLNTSVENAEWVRKRDEKKNKKAERSKFVDKTSNETHYYAYKRRSSQAKWTAEDYEKAKSSQTDFYRDADSLAHGDSNAAHVPKENVDFMVQELKRTVENRGKFSRKRKFYDEADVDYINDRNAVFNKKIARAYDKYTVDIKQNLERGTAL